MSAVCISTGTACEAPPAHAVVHVPMDGGEAQVAVRNGYVYKVRFWGAWRFVDSLSSAFSAAVQRAYEEMQP